MQLCCTYAIACTAAALAAPPGGPPTEFPVLASPRNAADASKHRLPDKTNAIAAREIKRANKR